MHPDSTNGPSDRAFIQQTQISSNKTIQYGFQIPASAEPPIHVNPWEVSASGVIDDGDSGEEFSERTSRLNTTGSSPTEVLPRDDTGRKSPSKKDTIRIHEAMGTSPTGKAAFRVQKTNWGGRKDSPIAKFPNEILIHALSFLDLQTLLAVALVSWRFYSLVTSPDAWRSAFSRYFPSTLNNKSPNDTHESPSFSSSQDRRYFTRLSESGNSGNTWRKEYILRTRLLRSLARGRANLAKNFTGTISHKSVITTYPAATGVWSVSHIAASFTPRGVRLLHASVYTPGVVSASDPAIGRIERAPVTEAFMRVQERPDLHQPLLGIHGFEVATDMGTSGVMDLSEDIGWVYGENVAGGKVYIHPYASPYITSSPPGLYIRPDHESIDGFRPAVTAVWIAKKRSTGVLETTQGHVGIVVGNSRGVVSIYGLSLGKENKLTTVKKSSVSPGIPIVSIRVDDNYSIKRMRQGNIWIVVANAVGEVYYLRDSPGIWKILPQTTRVPTALYNSTFPTLSLPLTADQQTNCKQTRDERLMKMDYGQAKELWENLGMDWFVDVDWVGQNIVVGKKQSIERQSRPQDDTMNTTLYRYHLFLRAQSVARDKNDSASEPIVNSTEESMFTIDAIRDSVFGGATKGSADKPMDTVDMDDNSGLIVGEVADMWTPVDLKLGEKPFHIITATAMDNSNLALLPGREDPGVETDVPGGDARLFAVGTHMGSIFLWNIRSHVSSPAADAVNTHHPLRVIHTESSQIATLALSSLYLVHGGTDGLVQAWDPLGSTLSPILNIHSRFSSRARRRLAQANAGTHGFDIEDNQYAARCIVLDPDATSLRGVVALGTRICYWSFPSTSTIPDKRRRKQGPRSRAGGTPSRGRGTIKEVIESEAHYLLKEKERERKEKEGLRNRYGVASGWEALSEEEMVEYATMISRETFERESGSSITGCDEKVTSSRTATPDETPSVSSYDTADEYKSPVEGANDEVDMDLAEALRLSLLETSLEEYGRPKLMDEVWRGTDSDFGSTGYNSTRGNIPPYHCTVASSSSSKQNSKGPITSYCSPTSLPVKNHGWERFPLDQTDGRPIIRKGKGRLQSNDRGREEFEMEMEMAIRLSLVEEEERRVIMDALREDDAGTETGKGKA